MSLRSGMLLLGASILFAACKKEPPNEEPRITINAPAEGRWISVPDTVDVRIQVRDDVDVRGVSAVITNAHGTPVAPSAHASTSGSLVDVHLRIPLTSESIRTGHYQLRVSASDAHSTVHAYRMLDVQGLPDRLRAVFGVIAQGGSTTLVKIDSLGVASTVGSYPITLNAAAAVSSTGMLILAGAGQGDLTAWHATTMAQVWSEPNQSIVGEPFFNGLANNGSERVWTAQSNGRLRAFDTHSGVGLANGDLEDQRPERVHAMAEHVVVTTRSRDNTQRWLRVHHGAFGTFLFQYPLALEVRAMETRSSSGELLLFGAANGGGRMVVVDILRGGQRVLLEWPSPVVCATSTGANSWLIGFADGSVERYGWGAVGSVPFTRINDLRALCYEPVSAVVYAAAGNSILAVDPGNGATIGSWPFAGPVEAVLPLRNR